MNNIKEIYFNKHLYKKSGDYNQIDDLDNDIINSNITVYSKKDKTRKIKSNNESFSHKNIVISGNGINGVHISYIRAKLRTKSSDAIKHKRYKLNKKYNINIISKHHIKENSNSRNLRTKLIVYRCQLTTNSTKEGCCCSCNSDAMFEVMKSLYDCYKMKNCDNCNCILCGHIPKEQRHLGEIRKSFVSVGLEPSTEKNAMTRAAEKQMKGKSTADKENILKELVKSGAPLPRSKTVSEKELIDKVRIDQGLPPEPKTAEEKAKLKKAYAAGIIIPLEGKTKEQKEKILRAQADMGITLPEGRSKSEKELLDKIKTELGIIEVKPSLVGKTPEEKDDILRNIAMKGILLPEGQTESDKKLIEKIRADIGLPPEPKISSMKRRYERAAKAGLMQPLEGKSNKEKEKLLKGLANMGVPLPEGRTKSEISMIEKIRKKAEKPIEVVPLEEKMKKAKAAGLLTPLEGKSSDQKENILKGLAMLGIPLPEGKTVSEKKIIDKVRANVGLPPEPKTSAMKEIYSKAADAGLLVPLEGKTYPEKEKILKGLHYLGVPLPEGRTASEKSLITRINVTPPPVPSLSERLKKAKAAGFVTPLKGKSQEQKQIILKGLAMHGVPLPEGKTESEKKLIEKVRADIGLPPEPKTSSMKRRYDKAFKNGLLLPLEGKSKDEKAKILGGLADIGIPLPEGRTKSEKVLIENIKQKAEKPLEAIPLDEKMRRAKAAGFITPLDRKTSEQKEKILKGLAMQGIPLPDGKTQSEKKLIEKVRVDLGLPPEPKTPEMRAKYTKAADAGLLVPLEGKTYPEKNKILKGLHSMGIPLPEGRSASEKSLIEKIKTSPHAFPSPSERLKQAKAAGLLTPLPGKTQQQKENILRGLAQHGIPLPEGKTKTEKNLINKIRADIGLPPEPKTSSMKRRYERAANAGLLQPLEGKDNDEKANILTGLAEMGIPLPEGRTKSEKSLIGKIKEKAEKQIQSIPMDEKIKKAKLAGFITPLEGKSLDIKEKILKGLAMHGIPLPEGKTPSEKKLIEKVRTDIGLPPEPKTQDLKEKYAKAADAGILQPLEGKTYPEKEKILKGLHSMGIPLPEGRSASEKSLIEKIKTSPYALPSPSERLKQAKAAGLLTPLPGKTKQQKENILRGLAKHGVPLPEGKTKTEKSLINKIRTDIGLPPEPKSSSMKRRYDKAARAGFLLPLEGKTKDEKKNILTDLAKMGIPLPEGRTKSEKSLIDKIKRKADKPLEVITLSEKMKRAKAAGLITPLEGKTPEQKEKILKGLAMHGIPLPEGKTTSEKKLIEKVRSSVGLSPEPKTPAMKEKYAKAAAAGFLQPLEGKSYPEKEKLLKGLHNMGIPLPQGRTLSEKSLIARIKMEPPITMLPSELVRKAKAAGLLTPLEGKTLEQKDKILRGLAMQGIPLPDGKTTSEKKLIDTVRKDLGLPSQPITPSMKRRHDRAAAAGHLLPLEGKTHTEKEKIIQGLANMGIPLPEGRTKSEKALIAKISAKAEMPIKVVPPEEKLRKAKAAGLLTPLKGKSPDQKEHILRGLAMHGIALPEGKTTSEKQIIRKVRNDLGLSPEPTNPDMREKYAKAANDGIIEPLEGKTYPEKEQILQGLHNIGIPLPVGRTASEKSLIARIKSSPPEIAPSEKMRIAKAAGLLTPLKGKSSEQKKKILKGLAMHGIPLPEAKTSSEKQLMDNVRIDLGLPPEPINSAMRDKYQKAANLGLLQPLEGKAPEQKEKILLGLQKIGIPLPEGRTASEKSLINRIKAKPRTPSLMVPSEKLYKIIADGLFTPLEGKSPKQQERILKGLAMEGIPLPHGKTTSEKRLIDKVRVDLGLPPEPVTPSMKRRHERAAKAGLLLPLEGKTNPEKEKILQGLADMGVTLPEGRSKSEKNMIGRIKRKALKPLEVVPREEKIKKAKAAGLITPLEDKTAEQKEKILKGLAIQGIDLPEGKTTSEKKIINKVRENLGLPPEPKTSEMRKKYAKAADAGLIQPLDGKNYSEKEKILQGLHDLGIPLPSGRTASEKSLIARIKSTPPLRTPSEKIRKARAEGLLTPLEGKTPEQKKKILKGLAVQGIPLPEGKTASEKKIINLVRADIGLPPEPKTQVMRNKHLKAANAGLLQPLDGKTPEQKEKILQGLYDMGIPLPEGRTASEKSLIQRIKFKPRRSSLLFDEPLEGKSAAEKDKIMRVRAAKGLPLPETKTASEKQLAEKIRKELGLSPEPKSSSIRLKQELAAAAGILKPLEGLTQQEKNKILKAQAEMGLQLPEGRTKSEISLIAKIKTETKPVKIISTKKLRKAKADGLLTPLEGKSKDEKENILKGLMNAGMPLPAGKTPSEKEFISKFRQDAGLPPESKVTITKSKKMPREAVKYEDILKTTTCDKACGCDKKKIRFKHSYVKIRVTSPDISHICPCPEECYPVPKPMIVNDGIKVTIGRAVGIPYYGSVNSPFIPLNHTSYDNVTSSTDNSLYSVNSIEDIYINTHVDTSSCTFRVSSTECLKCSSNMIKSTPQDSTSNYDSYKNKSKNLQQFTDHEKIPQNPRETWNDYNAKCIDASIEGSSDEFSTLLQLSTCSSSSEESLLESENDNTILMINTETSLSFSTSSDGGVETFNSTQYFYHSLSVVSCVHGDTLPQTSLPRNSWYDINQVIKHNISTITQSTVTVHCPLCKNKQNSGNGDPVIQIDHLNSEEDIAAVIEGFITKQGLYNASSIYVVVSTPNYSKRNLAEYLH